MHHGSRTSVTRRAYRSAAVAHAAMSVAGCFGGDNGTENFAAPTARVSGVITPDTMPPRPQMFFLRAYDLGCRAPLRAERPVLADVLGQFDTIFSVDAARDGPMCVIVALPSRVGGDTLFVTDTMHFRTQPPWDSLHLMLTRLPR